MKAAGPNVRGVTETANDVADQNQRASLIEQADMAERVPRGIEDRQIAHAIALGERPDNAAGEADLGDYTGTSPQDRPRSTSPRLDQTADVVEVGVREHDVAGV